MLNFMLHSILFAITSDYKSYLKTYYNHYIIINYQLKIDRGDHF